MLDSTTDRSIGEAPSDPTATVKQEWNAPTCTLLGDTRSLTEALGMQAPDSPATSGLS
jgi:hypothetical protein